jgi:hypothetical protein
VADQALIAVALPSSSASDPTVGRRIGEGEQPSDALDEPIAAGPVKAKRLDPTVVYRLKTWERTPLDPIPVALG